MKGTRDFAITYKQSPHKPDLVGYCDADWGGNVVSRKSTTGLVLFYASGPVMWRCKAQNNVAQSSVCLEAEANAITATSNQVVYVRNLYGLLGLDPCVPTILHNDNRSAIDLVKSDPHAHHDRSKHFEFKGEAST